MVVNDASLEHTAARVAIHIAMRMRADQMFCWPSIDHIAKETGVSRRAVSNALDILTGGTDEKPRMRYLHRKSRPNVGNIYSLSFPWV